MGVKVVRWGGFGEMKVTKNGFQIGCKGKINHDG